jgi:hypothetical protein
LGKQHASKLQVLISSNNPLYCIGEAACKQVVSRDLHCINHACQQVVISPIIILCVLPRLQISSRGSWGVFVRWPVALLRIYTCTGYDSSFMYVTVLHY